MSNLLKLYRKIEDFQANQRPALTAHYQCRNGCSRCCFTDLSIFEVEKKTIQNWLQSLGPEERSALLNKWKKPAKTGACAFLREDACTIYPARPLICRTQGLPLLFKENEQSFLDICDLNESALKEVNSDEILDLDRLNHLLAQIELEDSGGRKRDRSRLLDFQTDIQASLEAGLSRNSC
jgi:Fe-S-cluster containining protein